MKKVASIALVCIILLNTIGYFGVFMGLHLSNNVRMSRALDSDHYDPSNAITLRVPVSLPYMPDQSEFERVHGQFKHNGELYRLVKQRYAKDTLTVVCVKDTKHKQIDQALSDYVKTITDKHTDPTPTSKTVISFIKDYLPTSFEVGSATEGWTLGVSHGSYYKMLFPTFAASIIHPPERA